MVKKTNNNKNINVLYSVKKGDVFRTKNLRIVTRQDTKTGMDNPQIRKIINKEDYLNPSKQKQLYNDASNIFQELASQEETDDFREKIAKELIKLINTHDSVTMLIDLMYNLKNNSNKDKQAQSICSLNQKYKNDADPLVDLEIHG